MRWWLWLALLPLLGGCRVEWRREHMLACRPDEKALARDTLYFGASIPGGGEVDAQAWRQFEDDTLTQAFPQGYTIVDAHGLWRAANAQTQAEPSRIVIVLHDDTPAAATVLRDVSARYRERFHQESVLHQHDVVCARF